MILTAHQPAYLPWMGYFDKIAQSDVYVFFDIVQFEKNSFINRNKIKTSQGEAWLTIPVQGTGHMSSSMMDLKIDKRSNWQRKHFNSIQLNYKKAPYYSEIVQKIQPFYEKNYDYLVDICYEFLLFWLKELDIKTKIIRLSDLPIESKKSELIFDLCSHFKVDTYISGALGRGYLEEEKFKEHGIKVVYQNYRAAPYSQCWSENFVSNLSILDFAMNTKQYDLIKGL